MEAKLVREKLDRCYETEGVNHMESCKELRERYIDMLKENRVQGYKHIDDCASSRGLPHSHLIASTKSSRSRSAPDTWGSTGDGFTVTHKWPINGAITSLSNAAQSLLRLVIINGSRKAATQTEPYRTNRYTQAGSLARRDPSIHVPVLRP
ncbi:hypothetical protein NUW54_g7172 [Trametes sanguinea]|uniref:Uncharacterized protein n=1 Tax=Trametes sanguinea TaxID=158606 RepID=A0ACC1PQX4_9APHY|nr:hypothetical protein NUW54_g7172 [Trametes sanguinea]